MPQRSIFESQLQHYAGFYRDDPDVVRRCAALVAKTPTPWSRSHFDPGHFTASGCVLDCNDRVLLVHHVKLDRWLQPGGHIDDTDDSIEHAARREVQEECGVGVLKTLSPTAATSPVDIDIHEIPAHGREPAHFHFDVRYGFLCEDAESITGSEESHDVRWVAQADLATYDVDASARRLIRRCLAAARRIAGHAG